MPIRLVRKESTREEIANHRLTEAEIRARGNYVCSSLRPRSERQATIASQEWKADQIARSLHKQTGIAYQELRSEALYNICRIYENWDVSRGANFSTFVNRCLRPLMWNYLRDRSRMVKIPRALNATYLKMNKIRKANPGIGVDQIAELLGIEPEKVSSVDLAFQSVHSLDYIHNDDEREEW